MNCELIIVDASSTDNTLSLINNKCLDLILISTDVLNRSSSFNMGAKRACGKYICRIDSRSQIPSNYIENCYAFLKENYGYFNVGGKMLPQNSNILIEILYKSKISFGNADFRYSEKDKDVDSVYLGFFEKKLFIDLGGYDEIFGFINEETDLNYIAIKKGYKVRLLSNLNVKYFTRDKIKDYYLTMYRYGAARCGFFLKHIKLSMRIIMFVFFYLSTFLNIFSFVIYGNIFFTFFLIFQFSFLYIFFVRDLKRFKSHLSQKNKIKIFFQIVVGHIHWIKGFINRFFVKNSKYN